MSEPFSAFEEDAIAARLVAEAPPGAPAREPRSYLPTLFIANVGLLLAILTPVIVSMAFKLQHITGTATEATSALGLVLGVGALVALLANPIAGRLSDRTASRLGMRRPWLIGSSFVMAAALGVVGIAGEVWLVLIAWSVAQIAANAVMAAMNATIADQVPPGRRGRVSGVIGMGASIAILAGAASANLLPMDWARFLVPGVIGFVAVTVFAVTLRDRRLDAAAVQPLRFRDLVGSFSINLRKWPDFGWVWLTRFLVGFAYVGVGAFLPLYLTERFHLGEQQAVQTILVANLVSTLASFVAGPLGGWLSDRVGKRRPFVVVAGAILVVGLVLLAFAPNVTVVVVSQFFIGFGGGCFFAVDIALATQVLPTTGDTAKDLGVMSIANALPQSLAPVVAPPIIAVGAATALGGFAAFYLVGAVVALGGALAVYRVKGVK